MDILIFDLDGVLLKPHGYHKALQETVNLAGKSIGFGEAHLTDKQIAQFEALGISSEWHSSALCMAVMSIQKQVGINDDGELNQSSALQLDGLFNALASQPMKDSALTRGIAAIDILAAEHGFPRDSLRRIMLESESIELSPTLNWVVPKFFKIKGLPSIAS